MDRDVAERPFVHIPASSTFWGGWLTVSGVTAIGLISTGHPLAFLLALIFGFHAGFALKEKLKEALLGWGYAAQDLGPSDAAPCDYPNYAFRVAQAVANRECRFGVLICATGMIRKTAPAPFSWTK